MKAACGFSGLRKKKGSSPGSVVIKRGAIAIGGGNVGGLGREFYDIPRY